MRSNHHDRWPIGWRFFLQKTFMVLTRKTAPATIGAVAGLRQIVGTCRLANDADANQQLGHRSDHRPRILNLPPGAVVVFLRSDNGQRLLLGFGGFQLGHLCFELAAKGFCNSSQSKPICRLPARSIFRLQWGLS